MGRYENVSPVIVALDFNNERGALGLAAQLPQGSIVKVGTELHTAVPGIVRKLIDVYQLRVFLDLKFHDIPRTVASACRAAATQGVWMIDLHASGGKKMMRAAMEAVSSFGEARPLLVAVTVLTSMKDGDLKEVGVPHKVLGQVLRLATLAHKCGLDGVVCSPMEVEMLRANLPRDFLQVTPGIRPAGADIGDQKRIGTPSGAIRAGSDYLVVGRPITQVQEDSIAAYWQIDGEARAARDGGV